AFSIHCSSSNRPILSGSDASTGAGGETGAGAGGSSGASGTGGFAGTAGGNQMPHLGRTWTAAPPPFAARHQPPAPLGSPVVRPTAHVSLGGGRIRAQFSNLSGNGPVTINAAHVALCNAAPAVDSTIDTATDKPLAFSGAASVTIAQGQEVWSDPID